MYKFLLTALPCVFSATLAMAQPVKVILYPGGATVFEQLAISAGQESISLELPQVASPESLRASLTGGNTPAIRGLEYRSILPESRQTKQLEEKIAKLESTLQKIDNEKSAHQLAVNYWINQKPDPQATADAAKQLAGVIVTESHKQLEEVSRLQLAQTKVQQDLDEAKRQLAEQTGNHTRVWQVDISFTAPLQSDAILAFNYPIHQAGWHSEYILNAVPADDAISWSWDAVIEQISGRDWTDVSVAIATREPVFSLTPPENYDWNISQYLPMNRGKRYRMEAMVEAAPEMDTMVAAGAPMPAPAMKPVRSEGQIFDLYEVGKMTLKSGQPTRITVREGSWPSRFSYLVRPQQSTDAFLMAHVTIDKEVPTLPSGNATIQLEGVYVGKRPFALTEKQDMDISFGNDPALVVKVKTDHVAGDKGLISKSKTYQWSWQLSFTNTKRKMIELKVEDSYPHRGHDKIEVKELFTEPLPVKNDGLISWDLKLEAGQDKMLKYGYQISYPYDMEINKGR